MAITSTLVGSLGAGKVTESRFWFSDISRDCRYLDKSWNIPAGRHLLFWEGVKQDSSTGEVLIDGKTFDVAGSTGVTRGGHLFVDGPKTVAATGTGYASFTEDPYMRWVKVAV